MKRRNFCRYFAMGSTGFAGVTAKSFAFAMKPQSFPEKLRYRWVVLYWMPYDNNLVQFGEPIVDMLSRGTESNSDVAVVVQSDYQGDPNMRRRQLVNGTVQEVAVTGEDSSDVAAFSEYLDWTEQTFAAEHWIVIVVGHGGKTNEVSPDEHATTGQPLTWMGVDQFANAVSNFNRTTNGKVELLYFQNCNKATLEVIYEARNCARYTLASQLTLGAPNYYYEGFLNRLQDPSVGGREAAIAIMDAERVDMYHTLTLVDNQAVKRIPEQLSPVLQSLFNNPLPAIERSKLATYGYFGEQYCDLLIFLDHLSSISDRGREEFTKFAEFLRSSVIIHHKTGGKLYFHRSFNDPKRCGLGLYFPITEQQSSRYRQLTLYQEVDLVSLYRKMFVG